MPLPSLRRATSLKRVEDPSYLTPYDSRLNIIKKLVSGIEVINFAQVVPTFPGEAVSVDLFFNLPGEESPLFLTITVGEIFQLGGITFCYIHDPETDEYRFIQLPADDLQKEG